MFKPSGEKQNPGLLISLAVPGDVDLGLRLCDGCENLPSHPSTSLTHRFGTGRVIVPAAWGGNLSAAISWHLHGGKCIIGNCSCMSKPLDLSVPTKVWMRTLELEDRRQKKKKKKVHRNYGRTDNGIGHKKERAGLMFPSDSCGENLFMWKQTNLGKCLNSRLGFTITVDNFLPKLLH